MRLVRLEDWQREHGFPIWNEAKTERRMEGDTAMTEQAIPMDSNSDNEWYLEYSKRVIARQRAELAQRAYCRANNIDGNPDTCYDCGDTGIESYWIESDPGTREFGVPKYYEAVRDCSCPMSVFERKASLDINGM